MMRRKTFIFVLGICIGTSLLLFDNAVAEVTEASVASEKSESQKASTPQGSTTILTKVFSIHQNRSFTENDGRNTELTNRKTHDAENRLHDSITDSVNQDEKKDILVHANSNAEKTNDESENSSSDGSRKPRYGEIAVESSGKSTSTKVVSEDLLRLSRKNELTAATAKPAFDDSKQDSKNLENVSLQESFNYEKISDMTKTTSPNTKEKIVNDKLIANIMEISESKEIRKEPSVKYEEKNNVTVNKQDIPTFKSIINFLSTTSKSIFDDAVKSDEKKDKMIKLDHKEVVSRKDKNIILSDLKEEVEDHDREPTTVRGEKSLEQKKSVNHLGTIASEAFDLENTDEEEPEGSVSLVNDTRVNFNNFYKTVTERDLKTSPENRSIDANESRKKGNPKEEVEIVKNVTDLSVLRIITANDTTKNDSFNELSNQKGAYVKKKGETSAKDENSPEQNVDFSISNTTVKRIDSVEEWKSIGDPESQVKLPETTQSVRLEERTSSVPETTSSLVPQGRTIGFSGANKFPNNEVKTTASMRTDGETLITQSLQSSTEKIDQKPYPYLKSSKGSFQRPITEANLKLKKENGDVTEESSAYENTIGRGESEKKLVVTEPSVVIENSIQQHKPNKKNESTNSTTKSFSSLMPVTAISSVSAKVEPMNETFPEGFNGSSKATEIKRSKSNENDTSGVKEEEKVIVGRDEGYDVTGNGITEVSLTPDGKEVKSESRFSGTTESSTLRSTETHTSKAVSLNTDIQMEPEEAMMIRSTFVVTESTSVIPLDKNATTEASKSKTSMTAAEVNTIATMLLENSTESAPKTNVTLQPSSSVNHTTESPPFVTLNPDESPIPTTTSIEFEFVSLTEAISSEKKNVTEKSIEGQTFEEQTIPYRTTTIQNSSATDNSTENVITAMKPEEFTELPVTTEDGTPTTDQVLDMHHNETIRNPTITQTTTESQNNRTEMNEVTISVIDFTSDAAGNATRASGVIEDPSKSKDSSFDANITETSASGATELPPNTSIRTTMNVTKGPSATSTLEPIIFWSTMSFTESPEEEITENIQTPSPDEITLLVKIIIEGTLHEVCPRLSNLRKALADFLRDGLNKPVQPKQIVIHQNPCQEQNVSPTPIDVSLITLMIYVIDEDGKFDAAMTKILPSLYKVSPNFPVRIHKILLVSETDSGNAIAVVVVSSVAFICLLLLAGLLFIMRKRQTRFNYGERCRPVSLDAYSLDSVSAYNSVRRKGAVRSSKRSYGNPTFEDSSAIPSHPLNFAGLSSFCNDVNTINEEFAGIPQVSAKIDELPPGAEVKNRYANVIPLPETRVPLQRLNNDALTEYVNASYVRGPKNATKYYIACQAPIESTVTDFWRMIWEQQSKVIIMLTDLVENEVEKCTEYIPPSEITDCHRLYGDFQVTLKKRETKEKYAISTLHLKNLENNTFREVFHIWYLWPVSGVQSDGTGLIAVLLEARALQRGGPGPIVVHCSPGTGRTGTLIALDLGIRQYEITRTVDVPRVVYTIRRDRAGAVQTKEQYAFIYKALNLYATKLAGGVLEST
ncbi:PREDICTED: mucin-4 [Trachymyrmex cornetzi]|uniref:protein-tyrosine-phosphatase n=1 Tax=Trachymyrmex cornetzi TaxID=471704 RepID=A0A195DU76_9HYME|nr:PREDICTED: mucin-4 [Trachymyrmex cornetzi]KYN16433.1 Receptor-type tyrosine-protein phosphatase zeta [Trachymyrmex cornetzi]